VLVLQKENVMAQSRTQTEEDYYPIKTLAIPDDIRLEVGGIAVLPDGRIAISTRRGEIWMISNAYAKDGSRPLYTKFASGLHEVLGLAYKDGSFYCTQRGELTRITDDNQDGRADRYEPVYVFELSGNYHEYAYGPVFDKDGNMMVTLNVAWVDYGESLSKWHGWLLKIFPDGRMEPIAAGLRSPAGFTVNSTNEVLYAENQGDWVGSGRVTHLEKGDFAGNAGSLNWSGEPESPIKLTKAQLSAVDNGQPMHEAARKISSIKLPAVWFPHTLMGISTADVLEDVTGGAFGPFAGQYFVADQGHSKIMRMSLEKVNGRYQGACYPFREGFASGLLRLRWGIDGSIFGGMTSRGWASTGKADYALQQLYWNGKMPFEIKEVKAMSDGLQVYFTEPASLKTLEQASNYELNSFTYQYHHHYGSPIIGARPRTLKGIIPAPDGLSVRLVMDSLVEGYIHEVKLSNITGAEGKSLLHNVAYYTMNSIPAGAKAVLTPAQTVTTHMHQGMAAGPAKASGKPTPAGAKQGGSTAKAATAKRVTRMPVDWSAPDQVLRLGTKPGLKFDKNFFQVKAGAKLRIIFNNNDDMTHNLVITTPGAADEVGDLALKLGLKGTELNYVPNNVKVLYHTALLQPGSAESIYFTAPDKPGDYMFVCTYPGHASVMRGIIRVVP